MHQSIKREQHVPASSPPKKAKAPAPGTQVLAPSGLRLTTIWGVMFQFLLLLNLQNLKQTSRN